MCFAYAFQISLRFACPLFAKMDNSFLCGWGDAPLHICLHSNKTTLSFVLIKKNRYMDKIKITVFADPVCTWCWGSVPVIRALAYRYGEQLEIDYVMGGMIEDIVSYSNRRLTVGGDIALSNRNIHQHWLEASAVHGMPVCESGFHLFSDERRSTLPQNYAYITAKVYVSENEHTMPADAHLHFLRRLQEATAVGALLTNENSVIFDLSATVGFEPSKFAKIYDSEIVKKIYEDGKRLCRKFDPLALPTYLLEYRGEETVVRGYSSFEVLSDCIGNLSRGVIKPVCDGREEPTVENVRKFLSVFHNAYPVEVATAFSFKRHSGQSALNSESYEGLPDLLAVLVENGVVAMAPKGNGFMYYLLHDDNEKMKHRRRLAGVF